MASTEGGSIITTRSTSAPAAEDDDVDALRFDTPMTSLWTVLYELGGCTALGLELMYQASELAERCEKMNASNPFFPNLAQDVHAFFKVLRILELPSRQRATVLGKSSTFSPKKCTSRLLTVCCFVFLRIGQATHGLCSLHSILGRGIVSSPEPDAEIAFRITCENREDNTTSHRRRRWTSPAITSPQKCLHQPINHFCMSKLIISSRLIFTRVPCSNSDVLGDAMRR